MKKPLYFNMIACILPFFFACSSMQTIRNAETISTLTDNQSYQLRVRSGNPTMDKLIYEFASLEFSQLVPIVESDSYTGTLEIIFTSQAEASFMGSTTGFATSTGYGNAWYTGSGYLGMSGSATTVGSGITSGGTFTWQNSTMFAVLKDGNGKRRWIADYKYKGGWEMSGWTVNTADEAARLCIKRLAKRFSEDFRLNNQLDSEFIKSVGESKHLAEQTDRVKSFLFLYCQTYESKDLDKFAALFTPDAIENNRPFYLLLPKYRKNMEMIESFNYRIDLLSYSSSTSTGNIMVKGKYFTRFIYEGTLKENSDNISMELIENGDSYLVKQLNYTSRSGKKGDNQSQWGPWIETENKE